MKKENIFKAVFPKRNMDKTAKTNLMHMMLLVVVLVVVLL